MGKSWSSHLKFSTQSISAARRRSGSLDTTKGLAVQEWPRLVVIGQREARRSALNWYPPFPKLRESDQAWIWLVEGPIWFGYKVPGLSYLPFHLALASGCTAAAVFADNSPEGWRSDKYKAQGHYGTGDKGTSFLLSVGWIISYYLHSRTEWWPRGFESIQPWKLHWHCHC